MGLVSNYIRGRVVSKYNVEEEEVCCCSTPCNPCLNFLHFGCNYPCSLFQMEYSVSVWEEEARRVIGVTHTYPAIVVTAVQTY
jgi:hypothetical protein